MDDTVLKLLDELEQAVDEGRSSPFSNKVQVDKDEIFEIIDEIKMKLPNEIKQSKWIIEERNKILVDAQKEADEMLKEAEVRLGKLVEEHAVTKKAYEQAEKIMTETKNSAKEMRLGAIEYADDIMGTAEQRLREMQETIEKEFQAMLEFYKENINVIFENRQELKGIKKD
ncbi:ATPase [Anaerotignum sp. MSJ-24]|uniref:ATPase n=1 Tax=Anaerotignum sp. MSJ-24 TaxID=2841521 RepID=UPI001C1031C0|nr:ATPase [Anaerotignum sp. MSJ-24]MBU5463721.1 ATPase [Anaerotignum sp. MSJ-24]